MGPTFSDKPLVQWNVLIKLNLCSEFHEKRTGFEELPCFLALFLIKLEPTILCKRALSMNPGLGSISATTERYPVSQQVSQQSCNTSHTLKPCDFPISQGTHDRPLPPLLPSTPLPVKSLYP